jgi:hypothetical protein
MKVAFRLTNKTLTKQFQNSNKCYFPQVLKAKYRNTMSNLKAKQNIYILLMSQIVVQSAI